MRLLLLCLTRREKSREWPLLLNSHRSFQEKCTLKPWKARDTRKRNKSRVFLPNYCARRNWALPRPSCSNGMSIILSHTRDTLPAYPSLSPRSLAHLDILIYLYVLISAYTYLYLLQQTLRFSFDRSLADFHSDFLSFPSNFPFTTWTVFPFCFLCFRPSSSHTDPSILEPIRSRYRSRHSFSLSFSLSRSLRLPVRLVHRPTSVSATSSVFAPKAVFGCCVNKSTKVQVSFIVVKHVEFIESRLKVFEAAKSYRDTVIDWPTFPRYTHRFLPFSSFRLILDDAVAMIARTSEDLSFIIIR